MTDHPFKPKERTQMTESKRIMLIDDDPDDQLFFRDAIQLMHPELICELVSSCQEAFTQLEKPPAAGIYFYGFEYARNEWI